MPALPQRTKLPPHLRERVGRELVTLYDSGLSIREICAETGYSIGRVRGLLDEAGVTYRPRGGENRRSGALRAKPHAG